MLLFLDNLSGILMVSCYIPYVVAILRGHARPVRATWIVWATLDLLLVAGMHFSGTLNSQIAGACIGSMTLMSLSLFYGKPGWSILDISCFLGGITGIGLWSITADPKNAILVAGIVMLIAAIPTYVSAWEDPGREDKWAWLIAFASCVIYLPVLPSPEQWAANLEKVTQPLVFMIIEIIMFYLTWIRPFWLDPPKKDTNEG